MLNIIKTISLNAMNASKPTEVVIGRVIATEPIEIKISQKLSLTKEHLIFLENSFDCERRVETVENVEGQITVEKKSSTGNTYKETYPYLITSDKGSLKIKNGFAVDDVVVMLRVQQGQAYIVLGRVAK